LQLFFVLLFDKVFCVNYRSLSVDKSVEFTSIFCCNLSLAYLGLLYIIRFFAPNFQLVRYLCRCSNITCSMVWQFAVYKSSSSPSGSSQAWASWSSASYFFFNSLSIVTSGGWRAGISTNSSSASPHNLRSSHKNGFSKL